MDAANIVFQSLYPFLKITVIWDQDIEEGPKVAKRDVLVFDIFWYDFFGILYYERYFLLFSTFL